MTFATSNRLGLSRVAETDFGETPANPNFHALRITSETLNYNANFITSQELRSDRMVPDTVQTGSSAGGDISGEWSYGSFDDLIAAALYSDEAMNEGWVMGAAEASVDGIALTKTDATATDPASWELTIPAGNSLFTGLTAGQFIRLEHTNISELFLQANEVPAAADTSMSVSPLDDRDTIASTDGVMVKPLDYTRNGTRLRSFTVQKEFADLTTVEFQNFQGSRISTWNIELATGAILTTTFGLLAKDADMTETQFTGRTLTEANTNDVLNAVDNVAAIAFDGNPEVEYFFNSLSLTLDNALRGQEAVGTLGFIGIVPGRIGLTGSIELYFESSALFDLFRAARGFALSLLVQDGEGNAYIVTIPRAKYTSMEITAGGLDQDIFASADFEALIDEDGVYQFQVSRIAA